MFFRDFFNRSLIEGVVEIQRLNKNLKKHEQFILQNAQPNIYKRVCLGLHPQNHSGYCPYFFGGRRHNSSSCCYCGLQLVPACKSIRMTEKKSHLVVVVFQLILATFFPFFFAHFSFLLTAGYENLLESWVESQNRTNISIRFTHRFFFLRLLENATTLHWR